MAETEVLRSDRTGDTTRVRPSGGDHHLVEEKCTMANEKMTRVKMTMVDVMVHVFSKEYLGFVFGGMLNPIDVIDQLTLVLIKDAYHKTAEKDR